jgi:RsiW-degrading membrane proteinase PrsW (M82 family)
VAPAGQVGADSLAGRPGEDTAAVGVVSGHAGMSALSASSAPPQWTAFRPGAAAPGAWPSAGGPAVQAGVRRGGAINADQLKRALHILFPFRSWIDNAGWRSGVRLMFLVYAMLPVVFVVAFFNTTNFQTLGWVYAIYTAPIWLLAFWWLIKPEDPKRTLLIAGAVIGVIVLLVMAGPLQWYYNAIPDPSLTPGDWFSWLIAPGFAEELTKDGPVLLTVLAAGYFFKHRLGVRSCMFLGTVAGLVFGAREAALYQDKDLNLFNGSSGPHALVQYVLEFSLRIFTDGLQHAEWAGIACFFIGLGLNYTRRRIPLILFGFGFGAVLHATNDWSTGESRWLWLFLQVFSAALFLGYTLFAPSIEAQVRDTSLFRGESMLAEQVPRDEQGNPIAPGPAGHPS